MGTHSHTSDSLGDWTSSWPSWAGVGGACRREGRARRGWKAREEGLRPGEFSLRPAWSCGRREPLGTRPGRRTWPGSSTAPRNPSSWSNTANLCCLASSAAFSLCLSPAFRASRTHQQHHQNPVDEMGGQPPHALARVLLWVLPNLSYTPLEFINCPPLSSLLGAP